MKYAWNYTSSPPCTELDTGTAVCVGTLLYVHVFSPISWPPDNIQVQGNHQKLVTDRGLLPPNPVGTTDKDKVASVKAMKLNRGSGNVLLCPFLSLALEGGEFHKASSLDPCFFLIYMNDLAKVISNRFTPVLFADDFSILFGHCNFKGFEELFIPYLKF